MIRILRSLLREPLVQFLLAGGALFAFFGLRAPRGAPPEERIVVSAAQVENLAANFSRVWRRPPTPEELEGLIRGHVREEAAVRKALALGLDKDDQIIRRRLAMKLEFIAEDLAEQLDPGEEELAAYLQEHPESFRIDPQYTFAQVYLSPDRRGENLEADAAALLRELEEADDPQAFASLGDPVLLEPVYEALPAGQVERLFGERFAESLAALEPGRWHGPVLSGYGVHLVQVRSRTEGRLPPLEEVREEVLREWTSTRRQEGKERFYDTLLQRYAVEVERPAEQGGRDEAGAASEAAAPGGNEEKGEAAAP